MATANIIGGQTADTRLQRQPTAKLIAKAAAVASPTPVLNKPAIAPAVVLSLHRPQPAAPPIYNAAARTSAAKPATPQPSAAANPSSAKAAAPQLPATAKALAPAPSAKAAPPQPYAAQTAAPAANGALYATGDGPVVVDILASDSGYENKIYWSSDNWATRNYLGVDNQTASINLGSFAKGTKIELAIDNGQGDFFKSSGGNADGLQHTRVSADGSGLTIGFEDLRGGGDLDFNDAIVRISGLSGTSVAAATPAPAQPLNSGGVVPPKPAAPVASKASPAVAQKPNTKDNRSGLGDGTNPGNGTGRVNSPNTGTMNPNRAPTATQLAHAAANASAALHKPQISVSQPVAAKPAASAARKA